METLRSGQESRLTAEVRELLPGIVDRIQVAVEQNNFFSSNTKQLISFAISVNASEVTNQLLDRSHLKDHENLAGVSDTEQKIRRLLNNRIMNEVEYTIGKSSVEERNALMLLLRYNVLALGPQE